MPIAQPGIGKRWTHSHLHRPLAGIEEDTGSRLMDVQTAEEVREVLLTCTEADTGNGCIKAVVTPRNRR